MDVELLEVHLILSLEFSSLVIWLLEVIKRLLYLVYLAHVLAVVLKLSVLVKRFILSSLVDDVWAVPEHLIAKVAVEAQLERNDHQVEVFEEKEVVDSVVLQKVDFEVQEHLLVEVLAFNIEVSLDNDFVLSLSDELVVEL
jgi:hypothetical protein